MRVLFTHQPSVGHWHPLVPLAGALESAGHEVAFATTPNFGVTVRAKGFRCFQVGLDDTPEELRLRREHTAGMTPQQNAAFMLTRVFTTERVNRTLPGLLDVISEWKPDVVVRDNAEFAGCIAAELSGIPHAVVQVAAPRTTFLEFVAPPLSAICASVGLPAESISEMLHKYLVLFPRPMIMWSRSVPLPPTTHAFRYEAFNRSGEEGLPAWVAGLDGRPTVYATLGTVFNGMAPLFAAIIEGVRPEPVNLVVTVGRDQEPSAFGAQPPNVHIEKYVPQSLLLPHCDLVISHAGSGTMMDALSNGLPLVLVPIAADQPDNALLCTDLGVARTVEASDRTAAGIREAVRIVLADESYRRKAEWIRDEIAALPGLDYPVSLLERLAANQAPVVNTGSIMS